MLSGFGGHQVWQAGNKVYSTRFDRKLCLFDLTLKRNKTYSILFVEGNSQRKIMLTLHGSAGNYVYSTKLLRE